ncbi:MAG: phosphate/phosphite/phosphonate ABC transporter substrate-binding protein [Candidatus Methylomirabilis sp.]|nr:phosphate/phosphite/phosphonate ABC transporter substrate-binding protein [Candidatus Methylomirabilis sp.]
MNMTRFVMTCVAVALVSIHASAWSEMPKELRISAIPDENPTELMRIYTPFAEYLSREIGIPVKFYPVVDYAATVEGLAAKKAGYGLVRGIHLRSGSTADRQRDPLVSREEDLQFHSKFITRPDTGIKTLADLKGKTFSFGSVSSTSGHLMPRYFLLQNGINPERDFTTFSFSGAHDATALWVESGKVDAGALNEAVWDKLVDRKKVDPNKVKVFWTTPVYRLCLDRAGRSGPCAGGQNCRSLHPAELYESYGQGVNGPTANQGIRPRHR